MNFISVVAVTEDIAREQAAALSGYEPDTIGSLILTAEPHTSSRQKTYVFETTQDVTAHQNYTSLHLSDICGKDRLGQDGPVLTFGSEVTVGG